MSENLDTIRLFLITFWWWDKQPVEDVGKNKSVHRVSKITLTKSREDEIRTCFDYTTIEFHYPEDSHDCDMLLETFRRDSIDDVDEQNTNNNCNIFEEKKKFDRLIAMDDVSGFENKSNDLSNFLTICQKFGDILPNKIYLADDSVAHKDF